VIETSRRTRFSRQAAWVACLCFALTGTAWGQQKGNRPLPRYAQTTAPDQETGRRLLAEFRQITESAGGFFTFDFRILPRRGEERRLSGFLWRGTDGDGVTTRIALAPGAGEAEQRWLVRGGGEPGVWTWRGATPDRVDRLEDEALMEPLAGTEVTAFDLQMPFLYWTDFVFEGVTRVRGRTARVFLLYPPADFVARRPLPTAVRVYLDLEYQAMIQAEQLGEDGRAYKTMTVIDLKKVGDHWIVKSIDLRNETTRDKTRFSVTGAAPGAAFASGLFAPAGLARAVAPPADVEPIFP
jgi:hypothetical protein